jgi:hypothetical protein
MRMSFKGFGDKMTNTERKHRDFIVGNVRKKELSIQNQSYLYLDYLKPP